MSGFDPTGLDAVLDEATAGGEIIGAVAAIAHRGIVHCHAAGLADREAGRAMTTDAVFRLASLAKAVVCVAALVLAERGRLHLDAPVTRWLPWFTPALASGESPAITLRHLMTHTAGLGYGFAQPGGGTYVAAGISDGLDTSGLTLEENLRRLASVPLLHAPGAAWTYSLSIDVLGAVLEQVCGAPLPAVVADMVSGPLGLKSLGFTAAPGSVLATPYASAAGRPVRMTDDFILPMGASAIRYAPARVFDPLAFPSGGTGLIGTARDYLAFLEAVRTGATLGPVVAETLVANATGDLGVGMPGSGLGWGLGVAVVRDPAAAGSPLSAGSWQWGGVYGHSYWVDPAAELSVVLLTNTAGAGMSGQFPDAVRRAVHHGIGA